MDLNVSSHMVQSLRDKAVAPFCSSHTRSRPRLLRRLAVPYTCPLKAMSALLPHHNHIITTLHARRSAYHPSQSAQESTIHNRAHASAPPRPTKHADGIPSLRSARTRRRHIHTPQDREITYSSTARRARYRPGRTPCRSRYLRLGVSASGIRHRHRRRGLGIDGGRTARYDLAFGPPLAQHRE